MKKHIFTKLLILLLLSCNFGNEGIDIPTSTDFVNKGNTIGISVPPNFDKNPLVYNLKSGYNKASIGLNNIDNKVSELRITNTSKQDYLFIIKALKNNIGEYYYLNTRFFIGNSIVTSGSKVLIHLTFLDKQNYNDNDHQQFYTIFSIPLYAGTSYEIFKGWYRLEKTKNTYGNEVPILLKL